MNQPATTPTLHRIGEGLMSPEPGAVVLPLDADPATAGRDVQHVLPGWVHRLLRAGVEVGR